MLDRFFKFTERGSSVRTEVVAGFTTFAAMAYILAVNPQILHASGMDFGAVVTATALASALMTALFGLVTNWPIALAPGMGLNAFFAFTICGTMKIPWQAALAMVFLSGCCFLVLTLTGVREKIVHAIPHDLHRHRPVHRLHRSEKWRHRHRQPRDARHRRTPRRTARAAGARRHHPHRRAARPPGAWRHHPRRHRSHHRRRLRSRRG